MARAKIPASLAVMLAMLLCLASTAAVRAAGNELRNGSVSPGTGTTSTAFVFRVEFVGTGNAEAISVWAEAASLNVPLGLETGGSAAAGTWSGTALLPAGSWPVVFKATVTHGSQVTPLDTTVEVTSATTPPTIAPSTPAQSRSPRPTPADTSPPATSSPTVALTTPPTQPPTSVPSGSRAAFPTTAPTPRPTADPESSLNPVTTPRPSLAADAVASEQPGEAALPVDLNDRPPPAAGEVHRQGSWLLLGGSLAVMGAALVARQWIARRRRRAADRRRLV